MSDHETYVDVLRRRAGLHPDRPAFRFLHEGEGAPETRTYAELDAAARRMAAALQQRGLKGARALLLFEPGLEFVEAYFGCLYAGVVAVPVYPPRMNRSLERLQAIIADAGARAVLSGDDLPRKLARPLAETPELASLAWVTPAGAGQAGDWADAGVQPTDLAFLQYTSGSTSRPKGVRVTHRNLLANQEMMRQAFGHREGVVVAGWLPLYHDMGLIGNVLHPVFMGGTCIFMSPTACLQRPARWLEAVSAYRAETSGGPNFAYDLCVEKVTPEERERLDLSAWQVAFCGAEPVRAATVERFAKAFEPAGFSRAAFYPCYGLAEATLFVTGGRRGEGGVVRSFDAAALEHDRGAGATDESAASTELVGCGAAWGESRVAIVDPTWRTRCEEGQVGEVWVAGPHVARGYWNLPEDSERAFEAFVRDDGSGPFLRTGDLGFVAGGELFVTGRRKDLIIIRGRNLYPHDLEATADGAHPGLRRGGGAAFPVDVEGEERLVLVHEVRRTEARGLDGAEVARRVREAVAAAHEVQVHAVVLIRPATLPKTSSGKVQRQACRKAYLAGALDAVWPAADGDVSVDSPSIDALQPAVDVPDAAVVRSSDDPALLAAYLLGQAARVLRVPLSSLRAGRSLTAFGLDSLSAVDVCGRLRDEVGIHADPTDLLGGEPVAELARALHARRGEAPASPVPALVATDEPAPGEAWPLSHGQQALWFLHRMAPEGSAYNVAFSVTLRGAMDVARLQSSLDRVVAAHGALRTEVDAAEPVQRILSDARVSVETEDAERLGDGALRDRVADEAFRPFALGAGPMLRVRLFRRGVGEHVLLLAAHHLLVDLRSLEVVADELFRGYEALATEGEFSAPSAGPGYHDYVRWQGELVAGAGGERIAAAQAERLSGAPTVLALPTDRPRPAVPTGVGGTVAFALPAELTRRAHELARAEGVTPYVLLAAAYQLLLHRHSGQDDLLVGSPAAGRVNPGMAGLVGYLANPVVLRGRFERGLSFRTLLRRTRADALKALEGQALPFERLVEQVQPVRAAGHSPVFQAMFVLQQAERMHTAVACALGRAGAPEARGPLTVEAFALEPRAAQFDLSLAMGEVEGAFAGSFHYAAELFDHATVQRMAARFERLLAAALERPDAPVSLLPMQRAGDELPALLGANRTETRFDGGDALLHDLVRAQAARTPGAVAVTFEGASLTYAELVSRADALAAELRRRGVRPEVPVGVCMERSAGLVVALLAVLQAGGAYVPLDPDYPADRLGYMLADSGVGLVVTHASVVDRLPAGAHGTLVVEARGYLGGGGASASASTGSFDALPADPDNAAYVIYTSGSTGRPKGAVNTHRAIVNRLLWMQREYRLTAADSVLQKTPFSFDVSVWELFWPLIAGARLVVARPGGHREPGYLADVSRREGITTLHFVPSMLQAFLDAGPAAACTGVRRVVCSGEALGVELQERFFAALPGVELHNLYGPTEAAVDVTYWPCRPGRERTSVPIGRPVANTRIYVLDAEMQPLPAGVPGELHIAGVQVGRGYLNRSGLTAERFVPDPLSPTPGARMYRTGDRARWLPEGAVEYLGRTDFQVKVRGFRIEPGEVEAALAALPGVRECLVMAVEHAPGEHRLVAYVVGPSASAGVAALRDALRARLPEFMVPATFVTLNAMPLSPNGKVDRRALPAPDAGRDGVRAGFMPPRTPDEEAIAAIWRDVLGLDRVGVHDDFFELGGYSLLGVKVATRVQQAFGVELPLSALFQAPTVERLAREIAAVQLAARPDDEIMALLAQLEAEEAEQRAAAENAAGSGHSG
jgi:amino acid adenylation domain-containing protein